jgi:hypothetical protein
VPGTSTSRHLLLGALITCLFVAGCSGKVPDMEMTRVDAGIGLSLSIPKGYATMATGDGVRVYLPARENSRSPVSILISTPSQSPAWKDGKTNRVGERDVHYVIREEEGGSGGAARRLLAWTAISGRSVVLESVVQPDVGGDGEFRAEWAILAALR